MEKFQAHEKSKCHSQALSMEVIRDTNRNVSEMISADAISEKLQNRQMLLQIFENVRFLRRQGLPLQGNNKEGNFEQMLNHPSRYDPLLAEWLQKKRRKYTHSDSQNEFLKIMSLSILRETASTIQNGIYYTIMADEITNASNDEQFVLCLRSVEDDLVPHEDLIGLYKVPNICVDTLISRIRDALIRMNISMNKCRGQCY